MGMLHIHIHVSDPIEKGKINRWLGDIIPGDSFITGELKADTSICFWEVNKLFDWVTVRRLQKSHDKMLIFPIIAPALAYSSGMAIDLKLPSFLIAPIQRSPFVRIGRKIRDCYLKKQHPHPNYRMLYEYLSGQDYTAYRDAFYRRLLRGEISSEEELYEARSFMQEEVSNTVIFIQGFSLPQEKSEGAEIEAGHIVKETIKEKFQGIKRNVHLLSFTNHLLVMVKVPSGYRCLKNWEVGHALMHDVVGCLSRNHGIQLYIGIGDIHRAPQDLHLSYREARKSRRMPASGHLQVRHYADLPKNRYIKKVIDFIENHSHEQIHAKAAAEHINFSPAYFSKLFNKETGKSFVEYVTFIRIRKSLVYLRKTDHTIEEIAEFTGFNTPNYYSSTFRKYVGLTPSEYRATKEIAF